MPWLAAIGGIAQGVGGIAGAIEQGNAREDARVAYEKSVRDLETIGIPSVEAQQIVMQQYQSAGEWTPELEEAVKLGDSQMLGVSTDPAYREAQKQALSKLQQIGDEGGMTLSDRANLERQMGDIAATQRGARQAILQDAQQRGGYGSGTALAAQLMAQQGGADQAHMLGLETAGMAQKRALDAIMQGGTLGGQLREQEFNEKAQAAKAQDAINQWNAANRQDVVTRNTGTRNQALQYNLGNKQNLMNQNTGLMNDQEKYNKGLLQTRFGNQLAVNQAKAAARAGQAQNALAAGNASAQQWAGIGSGLGQAATAATQYQNTNQDIANRYATPQARTTMAQPILTTDDEKKYSSYA